MRPTPAEVAGGVVRILSETVAPAVTDDHARAQLRQVISVLRAVDWNGTAFALGARDEALGGLLGDCGAWVAGDGQRSAAFSAPPATGTFESGTSWAEVAGRHQEHRRALDRFLVELGDWRREHGIHPSSDALLEAIGQYLGGPAR